MSLAWRPRTCSHSAPSRTNLSCGRLACSRLMQARRPHHKTLESLINRGDFHEGMLGPFALRPGLAQGASVHHGDPVAGPEQLGKIRADHEYRLALRGELADQSIDLGFRSDVDTAGRL